MFHARLLENEEAFIQQLNDDPEFYTYIHSYVTGLPERDIRHGSAWHQFVEILKNNDKIVSQIGKKKKVKFHNKKKVRKFVKGT